MIKRRNLIKGLFGLATIPLLPKRMDRLAGIQSTHHAADKSVVDAPAPNIADYADYICSFHPPSRYHIIYRMRKAFDLHKLGASRHDAESKSRQECEHFFGISPNAEWPPVPWEKYDIVMRLARG